MALQRVVGQYIFHNLMLSARLSAFLFHRNYLSNRLNPIPY